MRDRLSALGRAHSLADPSDGQGRSDLAGPIAARLRPYRDHLPTVIEGPLAAVNRRHVSSLAMILHEWATNSVKYGALGSDDGSLSVTWDRQAEGLVLTWCERMARVPEPRPGRGFGTLLVEMSPRRLETTVTRSHDASAYRITLHLPELVLTRGRSGRFRALSVDVSRAFPRAFKDRHEAGSRACPRALVGRRIVRRPSGGQSITSTMR